MPREARKRSKSGIYHIMLRGINRQAIFEDDEDIQKLLETIKKYKEISKYEIFAYCIMSNHAHLLMKETEESLSHAIKRICGSYVYWYNRKYERCGHLLQERFNSEAVDSEEYFLTVIRYIHQNPLKAGLAKDILEYKWSSYGEYIARATIIDTDLALEMFSKDRKKAIELFKKFNYETNRDVCMDYEVKSIVSDKEVKEYLLQLGLLNVSELHLIEKSKRDEIIKQLKQTKGVSIRQLSRITGISKSVIDRAFRDNKPVPVSQ